MRVLLVSPYPPRRDGIGDYAARLAATLTDDGHTVGVVTPAGEPNGPAEVIGSLDAGGLATAARAFAPDVVHVQFAVAAFGSRTPTLVRSLAALEAPVVTTFHEVTRDTRALRGPGRALYRAIARRSTAMVVHTDPARRALEERVGAAGRPVHTIPHHRARPPAAETDAAALRSRHGLDDCRVLLAFGFIHVDKGLDDLVRAMALLLAGDPTLSDLRLAIAGEVRRRSGPFRVFEVRDRLHLRAVRREARRLGIADQIVESGYVPAGEVRAWFDLAEAVVLPYREIEQSGVASMAAALGAPVLATGAGTLAADFGDPRYPLPARDPAGLAAAIGAYLDAGGRAGATAPSSAGEDASEICRLTVAVYQAAGAKEAARAA